MSEDRARAVQQKLAALRDDYAQRSRTALNELLGRVSDLAVDSDVASALLSDVESQMHKLAGSGGTFGFVELSRRARELELSVRAIKSPAAVDLTRLRERIAVLEPLLGASPSALAARAAEIPKLEPWAAVGKVGVGKTSAAGGRVLLLEDDAELAISIQRTLLQFGYVVNACTDVAVFEAEMAGVGVEALLLDLGERDADAAVALLARIGARRARQKPPLPLIVLAGDGTMRLRLAAARAGASGFVLKPVDVVMRLSDRLDAARSKAEQRPHRVLLVDDDALLTEHYAAVLGAQGFVVDVVHDPIEGLARMAEFRPDLLLLDLYMPGCSGPELARVIRMQDDWVAIPIVFLSAESDLDLQLLAASEGADDFLTKPITDAHLVAAVRTRCERSQQLSELMNRDSLTGLLKHSRVKEQLLLELSRKQRSGGPVSVVMVDIDHFKKVNDSYGHAVGDQVIRALANLLRQRVRRADSVGRYGGEEFMLVLPDCSQADALKLIEDTCASFRSLSFRAGDQCFAVTLSAGIAVSNQFPDGTDLLVEADAALYRAKRGGRNQVAVAALAGG